MSSPSNSHPNGAFSPTAVTAQMSAATNIPMDKQALQIQQLEEQIHYMRCRFRQIFNYRKTAMSGRAAIKKLEFYVDAMAHTADSALRFEDYELYVDSYNPDAFTREESVVQVDPYAGNNQ